jgi:MFS family permease
LIAAFERLTGVEWKGQGAAFLVALGHSGTHWIIGSVLVLIPFIAKDLGLSYAEAGGLVTVFHVAAFVANAGSGAVVDVTGRRVLVQVLALVIGAGAMAASGFSTGMTGLIVAVAVIGLTNNLWHPAAISYLSLKFPKNRGYALSVHALGANFGDTVAPVAVGVMLVWFSWSEVVSLSAIPVFAIALWILVVLAPGDKAARTDGKAGMSVSEYLQGLAKMVKNRAVLGLCLMAGFRSMTQNGLQFFVPLYLVHVLGAGPVILGVGVGFMQMAGMISGLIAGTWSDTVGRRPIVLLGMAVTTVATVGVTFITDISFYIVGIGVIGFFLYSVRPVIHSWLMDLAPRTHGGSATSLLFGTQSGLTAAVPVVGGMVADAWGLPVVFHILAGIILIATIMVALVPDHKINE